MEYSKPVYILFAGVNGSGKSTLYKLHPEYQNLPRVNTDEIARNSGDWRNITNQLEAGKKAVKLIKSYLDESITFNQETTLCGTSILKNLEKAKKNGFLIEIHYIGVESAQICKDRIKARVLAGGHGIADADVDRRYRESFENMRFVLSLCDKVFFYDNTEAFKLVAIAESGVIDIRSLDIPNWLERIIN